MKRNVMILALALAGMAAAGRVAAQANLTVYGSAGGDGAESAIQLVGGTARFGGDGWAPEVGLQAYHLGFDAGTDNRTVWAVIPSVGASYRLPVGQVGARVGYSFQSGDDNIPAPVFEGPGGGSGVAASAQGNYWGPGPELQGIVSYNFGSNYLWSNAQALVPVAQVGPAARLNAGGEVVWQGSTESGGGNAIQLGPVVKLSTGRNFSVNAGAGWKHFGGASDRDDTWYARVGAVKYGIDLF